MMARDPRLDRPARQRRPRPARRRHGRRPAPAPPGLQLRLPRLQLRHRRHRPGRLHRDPALQPVPLLRSHLRSRSSSSPRRVPASSSAAPSASVPRSRSASPSDASAGSARASAGATHAVLIDHRPWARTYVNRGAYVHPYAHPYVRPAAPRVESNITRSPARPRSCDNDRH